MIGASGPAPRRVPLDRHTAQRNELRAAMELLARHGICRRQSTGMYFMPGLEAGQRIPAEEVIMRIYPFIDPTEEKRLRIKEQIAQLNEELDALEDD